MAIPKFANRAWEKTTTTGTGSSIALSGAVDNAHFTFAEAGVQDGDVVSYVIIDGTNVELQRLQTYSASGPTLSRAAAPHMAKIGGTAGTSQIELSGNATVALVPFAEDFDPVINVRMFGAVGDGVTDDTAAFSAAAQAAIAAAFLQGPELEEIQVAPQARVLIPASAGEYVLSSRVDTGGAEITWVADQGAKIQNVENLNGRLYRAGHRITDYHHGNLDYATSLVVRANAPLNAPSEVLGVTAPGQIATYTDRDSVALYVDNIAPPPTLTLTNASYTATTVIPASPISADDIKLLRVGMIIDTAHSPKYSGFITGWASDGSSITVEGWYQAGGGGTKGTPPSGVTAYVNVFTKVWAHNANVWLTPESHANHAAGFELGCWNDKADYNPGTDLPRVWGMDVVNLGTYRSSAAYLQRGNFYVGYRSEGASETAFHIKNASQNPRHGLLSEANHSVAFLAHSPGGVQTFLVKNQGDVEAGSLSSAGPVVYDFHTSGTGNDYDSRLLAMDGESTPGRGTLRLITGYLIIENAGAETARFTRENQLACGTTSALGGARVSIQQASGTPLAVNRTGNDGTLISFLQDGTEEGTISVSGTTVTLNGAHLSRWSQWDGEPPGNVLRGTVLSNRDAMCEWPGEDNEQLNKVVVSSIAGDRNVAGVYERTDEDGDIIVAQQGDFVIRIAPGVTVQRGDLLESNGDGCARPQDDDIVRAKTVAKVTSTHVVATYPDGSYLVPCLLLQ